LEYTMTECDTCGDEVIHVWRHRSFEAETRREVRWQCANCHPELPDTLAKKAKSEATDSTAEDGETVVMTDGGTFACPDCAGPTLNGQGLFDCPDCGWSGRC
jgi:Zn finger protein HypA/HybF involved in hydrogenase expression